MVLSTKFCWWCPSAGTQDYLSSGHHVQLQSFEYIKLVAKKCEKFGFSDILIPVSSRCLEPAIVASVIGAETKSLGLMLAARSGHWNPVHFARSIASLQLLYPNRIKINYVEGDPVEMIEEGDSVVIEDRFERKLEFIQIVERMLTGEVVSFDGRFFNVKNCALPQTLWPPKKLENMISGHSAESIGFASSRNLGILVYGGALKTVKGYINSSEIEFNHPTVVFGMAIQIFARNTSEEAWAVAAKFISQVKPKSYNKSLLFHTSRPYIDGMPVEELRKRGFWFNEILWYGLMVGKTHQRASLVGSYQSVAEELLKYKALGISYFILTADPNDVELDHIGKYVLPIYWRLESTY